jgi:hypothetical protein
MADKTIVKYRNPPKPKHRGHKAGMTIPLAIVGGLTPMLSDIMLAYHVGGGEAALGHVSLCTTGYDPADGKWKPAFAMQKLYGPLFIGVMVHKVAGRLGINRMISKAGIPLFRI